MKNLLKISLATLLLAGVVSCGHDDDGVTVIPVVTVVPDGGAIAGGPFDFSVGDGEEDKIADGSITINGAIGAKFAWVVTDADGKTILGIADDYTGPNFETAGVGNCLLWYLAYNGELEGAAVDGLVANLKGDFDLSNSIAINRTQAPNIVGLAQGNANFSLLVEAVTRPAFGTEYTDLLSSDGPLTVFAPTNDAFVALLTELGVNSLGDIDDDTLKSVLNLHVIADAKVKSTDLPTEQTTTKVAGGFVKINGTEITDGRGRVANVVGADNFATNGVVHAIDKVLLPADMNIVMIAQNNPAFSSLVTAITRPSFGTTFIDILTGDGPLTVFAPTNDAFEALLAELGLDSLADVDDVTLEAVLKLHVIAGAEITSLDLPTSATEIETAGGMVTINGTVITDANGRESNVIIADVDASNGVIHAIDKVILPKL